MVKAVVTDFSTAEGRSAARDGLKAKFADSQATDLKNKSIYSLRQVSSLLDTKAPGDAAALKLGFGKSARALRKRPLRVVVYSVSAGFR